MRVVVLGATGTVGRRLCGLLADRGAEVVGVGRNRVLLAALGSAPGVEPLALDVTREALPAADVLVDLTLHERRLPRDTVRASSASIERIDGWLGVDPARRAVHAGTFVVAGYGRTAPPSPCPRLVWDDSYLLSKSAAERQVGRSAHAERLALVRLGNVVTPDSAWGALLLRSVAAGAVSSAHLLDRPAGLCDLAELVDAVLEHGAPVVASSGIAGWTWREALDALAARAGTGGDGAGWGSAGGTAPAGPVPAGRSAGTALRRGVGRLVRQGLWVAPPAVGRVRTWDLAPVTGLLKGVQALAAPDAAPPFPPALPELGAISGAARDVARFEALVDELATALRERGYVDGSPSTST